MFQQIFVWMLIQWTWGIAIELYEHLRFRGVNLTPSSPNIYKKKSIFLTIFNFFNKFVVQMSIFHFSIDPDNNYCHKTIQTPKIYCSLANKNVNFVFWFASDVAPWKYLEKFDLAPVFTIEEFHHWFSPQNGIINSFVVENDGKITDMVSYYTLPSSVMHHATHKTLKAAYSFYNVSTITPWIELMTDALISARNVSFFLSNLRLLELS